MEIREKYNEFVENISIENISLKYISAENMNSTKTLDENQPVIVQVGFDSSKYEKKSGSLYVEASFKVEAEIEKNKPIFDIKFIYLIEYTLKEKDLSEVENIIISKFTEKNTPVNIWPYARELISSVTTRMGYPAFIIKPFIG